MADIFVQSLDHLNEHGYVMLKGAFETSAMRALGDRLSTTLQNRHEPSVLQSRGQTYGSRNLLETFPEVTALMDCPSLREFAAAVLGPHAGVVRVLYFDKPPDRSWSLPWHKDRTIAVKRNDLVSKHFRRPTVKADVAHVEAPESLLVSMLTLRIHLDAMTDTNGPLSVIPGSHRAGDQGDRPPVELHAETGDLLAMRPLLSHSSSMPRPGTISHRRVIHFETAPCELLEDGYEWHTFVRCV